MNKICYGCGSKLQSSNKEQEGYIPKEKIETSVYCQRCFRLMHYGENKQVDTPKELDSIIKNINSNAKFVLFLTDFITLNMEIIKAYRQIKVPKVLAIGKCDLIPKSINYDNIIACLRNNYKIKEDIILLSSETGFGVKTLLSELKKHHLNECYIVGESNSGKSTLINKMIELTNSKLNKITTSNNLNTTLDFIRLKLSDDLTIIDSPGFVINSELGEIKKTLKPKTYQMKENEILCINNIYLRFNKATSVTIYMDNELDVKKYFKELEFDFKMAINNNTDIIIKRLGFINIKNKCNIEIKNVNTPDVEVRKSIFGGNHE